MGAREFDLPDVFPPGSTHSTFSSNTLGTAVALEAVRMIAEEDHEGTSAAQGGVLLAQIKDLQRRYPKVIGHTDGTPAVPERLATVAAIRASIS